MGRGWWDRGRIDYFFGLGFFDGFLFCNSRIWGMGFGYKIFGGFLVFRVFVRMVIVIFYERSS